METPKNNKVASATDAVTTKAATLVETAADLADRAFEDAVDRADMTSAKTSDKLIKGAHVANKQVHKNSRAIGVGAIVAVVVAVAGAVAWIFTRGARRDDNRE